MSYVWMTETYFPFAATNTGNKKNTQAACLIAGDTTRCVTGQRRSSYWSRP